MTDPQHPGWAICGRRARREHEDTSGNGSGPETERLGRPRRRPISRSRTDPGMEHLDRLVRHGSGAARSRRRSSSTRSRPGRSCRSPQILAAAGTCGGAGRRSCSTRRADRWIWDPVSGSETNEQARFGRGPLRPAGAGDPGTGRGGSAQEGHDAAQPRTPAGDLPEPGGPGAGHVGHPVGSGQARAQLSGPLAVGADAAQALEHVLAEAGAGILWQGHDGSLAARALLLADGSTIRVSTGTNPWATPEPGSPAADVDRRRRPPRRRSAHPGRVGVPGGPHRRPAGGGGRPRRTVVGVAGPAGHPRPAHPRDHRTRGRPTARRRGRRPGVGRRAGLGRCAPGRRAGQGDRRRVGARG